MRYDGTNLDAVCERHMRWLRTGGENDDDRADFSDMVIPNINLSSKQLYGADFRDSFMACAKLCGAHLEKADFTGANLHSADFSYANLRGAIGLPYIPLLCPSHGAFVGWKRLKTSFEANDDDYYANSVIAKLLIPEAARRTSNTNRECRADKVQVLEIQTIEGETLNGVTAYSIYDHKTEWRAGKTLTSAYGDERFTPWQHGLYFYIDRAEAVDYLTFGEYKGQRLTLDFKAVMEKFDENNNWDTAGRYWED